MAEDWDHLADEYEDNDDIMIAKVDCTRDDSKKLCQNYEISSYPTLRYGDVISLQDYNGQRDLRSLREVVEDNLEDSPLCSVTHPYLCDLIKRQSIEDFKYMGLNRLDKAIKENEEALEKLEQQKDAAVKKLRKKYTAAQKKKERDKKEFHKHNDLSLMKEILEMKLEELEELLKEEVMKEHGMEQTIVI